MHKKAVCCFAMLLLMATLAACGSSVSGKYGLLSAKLNGQTATSIASKNYIKLEANGTYTWSVSIEGFENVLTGEYTIDGEHLYFGKEKMGTIQNDQIQLSSKVSIGNISLVYSKKVK